MHGVDALLVVRLDVHTYRGNLRAKVSRRGCDVSWIAAVAFRLSMPEHWTRRDRGDLSAIQEPALQGPRALTVLQFLHLPPGSIGTR